MAAHQAPPSLGFSRQKHWSGLPFPSPMHESEKWKGSRSVVSNSSRPPGLQPTRLLRPWDFPGKSTGVGCHRLLRSLCWVGPKSLLGFSVTSFGKTRMNILANSIWYTSFWFCLNHWPLATFGMPMTTQPYQATEERKHLTTGGPGKCFLSSVAW